jgi:UPF0755 protein
MRLVRALILGVTLALLLTAAPLALALSEIRAAASPNAAPVEFTVEEFESGASIAERLSDAGLIRQPLLFRFLMRRSALDQNIQPGRYVLSAGMSMSQMMVVLQSGEVIEDIEVTFREGLRLEEYPAILAEAGLIEAAAEFAAVAADGSTFADEFFLLNSLPAGATLEGYLFPDTYRFAPDADAETIVRTLVARFVEQYSTFETQVQVADVNVHEIVTMASIVQREAVLLDELPLISAVFWNRLKPENAGLFGGGLLGADPTIQYALGFDGDENDGLGSWWQRELTVDELAIDSPYNTRLYAGLPPGPIASPGLAALLAAAKPDGTSEYTFFVASCARDGSHRFAATYEEFLVYEAEWLACQ